MNRYRNTEEIIDVCVQTGKMTSEVLRTALRDFLDGKTKKKGNISFEALSQKGGKLESIEVNDNNIKDFLTVASKYDVDFSLKRDSSISPPIYHVFFSTGNSDNFKRAFKEYVQTVQNKVKKDVHVDRAKMQENAAAVTRNQAEKQQSKERTREKSQFQAR